MDRWNEHTMEMELESMDRQGEAMEIRLSRLGLAGAILSEHEIERLQAEVARLKELQPCGHPIQAIRSTPYIDDQHSNYCGWCADVEHERELSQALTVELLAYREKVARLREALEGILQAEDEAGCSFDEQGNDWPDIEVARAALSDTAEEGEKWNG